MAKRQPNPWSKGAEESLRNVYVEFDTPSDQIAASSGKRRDFRSLFMQRTGLICYNADELVDKLIKLRKSGGLPRIVRL